MNAKISLFGLATAICLAASVTLAGPSRSSGRSSSASHFSGSSGSMSHGYSGASGPRISNGAITSRTYSRYGGSPVRSSFAARNAGLRGTRNWNGNGNWSSNNHHHHHHRNDFVFFGDFGYPFGYPYWWDYYPYSYYDYDQPVYEDAAAYDDNSLVAQVQSGLARSGYYHGAIDGAMGPETRRAIRGYERSHGLRVDGTISNSLIGTMGLR